jgi:hypothetical protein
MLDKFRYVNHLNEVIEFGKNGIFANASDLRDYEWSYNTNNDMIGSFKRSIATRTLPTIFCGSSGQACRTSRNNAYVIAERDVIAEQKGRIYVGDYYMNCYIYSISNSDYLKSERLITSSMKICTDDPVWRTEKTFVFDPESADPTYGVDFEFDYPFDFQRTAIASNHIQNDYIFGSDFRLVFYGPVSKPSIKIGEHTYGMNKDLLSGERIEIDSSAKKIRIYSIDGSVQNGFNQRYKQESVFYKIPYGVQKLSWSGEFRFDITLIDARSEPPWKYNEVSISDVADVVEVGKKYYLLDSAGSYILDSDGDYITVNSPGMDGD